jgi:hypothetical protein
LENCFSIQLYSFQIFFASQSIHEPSSSSHNHDHHHHHISPSLESFLCFSSFFSFHSNENHLNIIVIFFLASANKISFSLNFFFLLSLLFFHPFQPSYFHFNFTSHYVSQLYLALWHIHVLAHHSHYTQNGWIFFSFLR